MCFCYHRNIMKELKNKIKEKIQDKHAVTAAASYLVFFYPRFTQYKTDLDVHFHMKQGIGLLVFALSLQGVISILGYWGMPVWRVWPVRIVLLYLLYIGIRNALHYRKEFLPWIGKYADKTFEE